MENDRLIGGVAASAPARSRRVARRRHRIGRAAAGRKRRAYQLRKYGGRISPRSAASITAAAAAAAEAASELRGWMARIPRRAGTHADGARARVRVTEMMTGEACAIQARSFMEGDLDMPMRI
jgi:hypothetical protein